MCTLYGNVGAEACAANPESCQVDRISVMNEDGRCPEYQCADGYAGGQYCTSMFTLSIKCFPVVNVYMYIHPVSYCVYL